MEWTSVSQAVENEFQTTATGVFQDPSLPEDVWISKEFNEMYKSVVGNFVSPMICVFGLIGNSFGLLALRREMQNQAQSTFQYMFALITFDIVLLLSGIVDGIFSLIDTFDNNSINGVLKYFDSVKMTIYFVNFHSSSALLITMAIERLNATVRPFKCKESCLFKYPKRIIFIIFASYLILNAPFAASFATRENVMNGTVNYDLKVYPSPGNNLSIFARIEASICTSYSIVLVIINAAIAVNYLLIQRRRLVNLRSMSSRRNHTMKITVLVCWISIMYIVNLSPRFIHHMLTLIDNDFTPTGAKSYTHNFFVFNWNICARINAANDFLIYFMLFKRYRKAFCNLFSKAPNSSSKSTSLSPASNS